MRPFLVGSKYCVSMLVKKQVNVGEETFDSFGLLVFVLASVVLCPSNPRLLSRYNAQKVWSCLSNAVCKISGKKSCKLHKSLLLPACLLVSSKQFKKQVNPLYCHQIIIVKISFHSFTGTVGDKTHYKGPYDCLKSIYRTQGIKGWYKGLVPMAWR